MTEFVDRRANNGPLPDDVANFLQSEAEGTGIGTYGDGADIAEDRWTTSQQLCKKYDIIYCDPDFCEMVYQPERGTNEDVNRWSDGKLTLNDGTEISEFELRAFKIN